MFYNTWKWTYKKSPVLLLRDRIAYYSGVLDILDIFWICLHWFSIIANDIDHYI